MNDSTQFKIEKGIPVPAKGTGRASMYPWDDMEIGDSFFVKGKKSSALSATTKRIAKTRGFKFTVRQLEGGVRVWRIA